MNLLSTFFIVILIMIVYRYYSKNKSIEGFNTADCPNCGQRDKLQCFQCDGCGWAWNDKGYGECIPGNEQGPYFAKDTVEWQYRPDPITDYKYYLPGWRRWWWWKAPDNVRDRLNSRYIFRQPLQI